MIETAAPPINPGLFHFPVDKVWLQHCAEGPVPRVTVKAVQDWMMKELWPWQVDLEKEWIGIPAALREEAAKLIGVEASDITLTPSTSSGLITLAQSLTWRPGDEVMAPLGEFPSNAWPWKALDDRGVTFREIPLWVGHRSGDQAWDSTPPRVEDDPEDRIIQALTTRTRVLTVSWVRFQDGLKLDLLRLGKACKERDILLVVDGIQGAGFEIPDLSLASAFATGGQKGLLGTQGQGFLWTDARLRRRLQPTGSWLSVEDCTNFARTNTDLDRAWLADGRRMEQGSLPMLPCVAALESWKLINQTGPAAIGAHVRRLQAMFLDQLADMPEWSEEGRRLRALLQAGRLGSILSIHHGGRGPAKMQELLQQGALQGVLVSLREGYLRIAFHGYHQEEDLERVLRWFLHGMN